MSYFKIELDNGNVEEGFWIQFNEGEINIFNVFNTLVMSVHGDYDDLDELESITSGNRTIKLSTLMGFWEFKLVADSKHIEVSKMSDIGDQGNPIVRNQKGGYDR